MKKVRFLGLDVHAETIAVAVAEPDGEVRSLGIIPNREESVRKLVKKLGAEELQACYEAGPTGYVLYWQLTALGVKCEVVAPSLVPVKAGDRVKTDRRDATKLARNYRAGDLTAVWVPNEEHEALRDLVRAREAAKQISCVPGTGSANSCYATADEFPRGSRCGRRGIRTGLRNKCTLRE
jgi:transposase